MFQNHSLLPWLTCFDNVHLAVERVFGESETRADLKRRTHEALALVGLTHAEHKMPHEVSGGMKQRVGIARALAMQPKVLLLDEPFGALDALTRARLQDELMKIVQAAGSTVLMVTHDVDEAVLLADRIVMMTNGPAATIGEVLKIELPRPRDRVELNENRAVSPLPHGGARVPVPAAGARRAGGVTARSSEAGRERRDGARRLLRNRADAGRRSPPALVVIGNGMAGMRTVEELLKLAPDAYEITVFGSEPHPNYNRILLSPVLAGEQTIDEIVLNTREWYAENGITLHAGSTVSRASIAHAGSSRPPTAVGGATTAC